MHANNETLYEFDITRSGERYGTTEYYGSDRILRNDDRQKQMRKNSVKMTGPNKTADSVTSMG